MNKNLTYQQRLEQSEKKRKISRFIAMIALLAAVILLPLYSYIYKIELGPEQPIPFSHRVHSGKKQISCLICHTEATFSGSAGMPPAQTCMLCHAKIIVDYWPIKDLHKHYYERKPILWNKVTLLPGYAYFSHRVHVQKGIDCGHCHGDIKNFDRVELVHNFRMDFCITCHRTNGGSTGCYTCHR